MADNQLIPPTSAFQVATDDIGGVQFQRAKIALGADGVDDGSVSSSNPLPVSGTFWQATQPVSGTVTANAGTNLNTSALALESGGNLATVASEVTSIDAKMASLGQKTASGSMPVVIASDQTVIPVIPSAAATQTYTQAGVITINTVLLTLDLSQYNGATIQCTSMGTSGTVTPEWSNDNSTWVAATIFTAAGASATTFNAAGLWNVQKRARYLRLRLSVATTAGTTTIYTEAYQAGPQQWLATQPVSGTVALSANTPTLAAGTNRAGFIAGAGIWYDDSSATLAGAAVFTGTARDATLTATATAWANAATYAKEVCVSAESDVTGTLWLEVSRDNTNWRRAKSVATSAVTGGGFYAEIVHRPSWRYWRCGYTNGAGAQARFTIGSIAKAI